MERGEEKPWKVSSSQFSIPYILKCPHQSQTGSEIRSCLARRGCSWTTHLIKMDRISQRPGKIETEKRKINVNERTNKQGRPNFKKNLKLNHTTYHSKCQSGLDKHSWVAIRLWYFQNISIVEFKLSFSFGQTNLFNYFILLID